MSVFFTNQNGAKFTVAYTFQIKLKTLGRTYKQ